MEYKSDDETSKPQFANDKKKLLQGNLQIQKGVEGIAAAVSQS